MSDREAVLHYYELEYFEEDLVLILLNTICDKEDVDISTHGYTRNGIPDAKDAIRLDLVGGFVLQKVSSNKSYFRAIANMDIKVDFLPPSLINFISRQLIGNGHKLYQKALASIAIDDDDYNHALEEPMYVRIREGQKSDKNLEIVDEVKSTGHHIEEPPDEASQVTVPMADRSRVSEIEEVTGNVVSPKGNQKDTPNNIVVEHHARKGKAFISPEVEHALDVLDEAISIIRERGYAFQSTEHELPNLASVTEVTVYHNSRSAEGDIKLKKTDHDQTLPVLPDQNTAITNNTQENPNSTHMLVPENMSNNLAEIGIKANGIHMNGNYGGSRKSKQKLKKQQLQKRFCCFSPI